MTPRSARKGTMAPSQPSSDVAWARLETATQDMPNKSAHKWRIEVVFIRCLACEEYLGTVRARADSGNKNWRGVASATGNGPSPQDGDAIPVASLRRTSPVLPPAC